MSTATQDTSLESIDTAILDRVSRGDVPKFAAILASVRAARKGICPERLCDRRLQALKRAGKIVYTGHGWAIMERPKTN
ncbi:hypothetical protein [Rhodanobacter sp. FW106-PBR-LB-2-11]|uniref:hypothetical protein n=1 Tax=Rhodanobacter sp. FW106-PBR-LB-2-11 TaxID=1524463 RepID=UPI0034E58381